MSQDLFGELTFDTDRRFLKDADGRKLILIGFTPGKKCKECDHYYLDGRAKVYRRCELYPKKNWKANFDACIKFEENKKV